MVYGPGYGPIYPAMITKNFNECGLCRNQRNYGDWLCGPCRAREDQFWKEDSMEGIGKSPDHGRPPEIEADPDLEALTACAEFAAQASEQIGSIDMGPTHDTIYVMLGCVETLLLQLIQQIEKREERQHEDSVPEMRF